MNTSTGDSVIQQSYPPPPPWYTEFKTLEDSIKREPPPQPERTFTCFGWPRISVQNEKPGVAGLPQLDSDTKLFSNIQDLKGEFQRLFDQLVDTMLTFIDNLSQSGYPGASGSSSPLRSIIKLHKNLQHILTLLRDWEARDEVVAQFERQLKSRLQLIERLRECLVPSDDATHTEPEEDILKIDDPEMERLLETAMSDVP
ncbi:uncharacterized protein LOC129617621 [Condylostylus longicornis]|uniref:uncharacterized protein LOC129617621 n=1 Tax=Condylostylus longicornis TaxID=2530218 RepID=UPI00244E4536|nr:uncharacterized protein LOC129617621 [Condylostylus longicornis]